MTRIRRRQRALGSHTYTNYTRRANRKQRTFVNVRVVFRQAAARIFSTMFPSTLSTHASNTDRVVAWLQSRPSIDNRAYLFCFILFSSRADLLRRTDYIRSARYTRMIRTYFRVRNRIHRCYLEEDSQRRPSNVTAKHSENRNPVPVLASVKFLATLPRPLSLSQGVGSAKTRQLMHSTWSPAP